MKLESAQIRNFRMLKELDIDFEDVLSLVIGKIIRGKHHSCPSCKSFSLKANLNLRLMTLILMHRKIFLPVRATIAPLKIMLNRSYR